MDKRMSASQKRKYYEWLKKRKSELEETDTVKSWQAWEMLPFSEKSRIRNEWDNYYKKLQETRAYKRFQEQMLAMKENRIKDIILLAQEARKDLSEGKTELAKPLETNPYDFDGDSILHQYKRVCGNLEQMGSDYEMGDIEEIFEVRKPYADN